MFLLPRIVRRGDEEGIAGVGESEDEGLVGRGGAGGEDQVVGIKPHFVAPNL